MRKLRSESVAREAARHDGLAFGMSVLDGAWYVGTEEQLERIGCMPQQLRRPAPAGWDRVEGLSEAELRSREAALGQQCVRLTPAQARQMAWERYEAACLVGGSECEEAWAAWVAVRGW